jgi:hypothetical protein
MQTFQQFTESKMTFPTHLPKPACIACGKKIRTGAYCKPCRKKREEHPEHYGLKENASPVVKDYLKHLDRAMTAHNPQKVQDHLRNALVTHKSMTAAGRKEAEKHLTPAHHAFFEKAKAFDNYPD